MDTVRAMPLKPLKKQNWIAPWIYLRMVRDCREEVFQVISMVLSSVYYSFYLLLSAQYSSFAFL
jgi:hypothetical protein